MITSYSQLKDTFKVFFNIKYRDIEIFEEFFAEKASATSMCEIKSDTIESKSDDIWNFEAYYNHKPNLSLLKKQIQELAKYNNLEIIKDIYLERIEDKDWVAFYQSQLTPIETKHFFISTKLHLDKCPKDKILLLIEASRAFGTGQHETTLGCLEAIEDLADIYSNDLSIHKILDIGTGTGILSFAAEKLWSKAQIFACDIDKIAVEIAGENAKFNNSNVIFYKNSEDKILLSKQKNTKFDLIIGNILASPLIELSSQIGLMIEAKGHLILSGFLDYQLFEVKNAYQSIGFEPKKIIRKNSWVILILQFTGK
ncbi:MULTISPECIES: 50S ribosomal protein L11 methyltransferase [unclassified Rickettsia]|uniref:50S ribosomal protein L11 methyltransferase n=1 Tax=unclassified Rickettsia TaxID=114295 RepID=UPI0020A203CE|nr:50S ribosomal protein L11 methyltransferase [Rickettsia endosymbiont of Ceutorhynchus assimilis]